MDAFAQARQKLESFERLREDFKGIDLLNSALETLFDLYGHSSNHLEKDKIVNICKTYRKNTQEWIRKKLYNVPSYNEINYYVDAIDAYQTLADFVGKDEEFDRLRSICDDLYYEIKYDINKDGFNEKLNEDEQLEFIGLIEKLNLFDLTEKLKSWKKKKDNVNG